MDPNSNCPLALIIFKEEFIWVNEDAKKVWAYIDEHEQEYIDLLKKYCAQPSVSAQNWGMREMAEMILPNHH